MSDFCEERLKNKGKIAWIVLSTSNILKNEGKRHQKERAEDGAKLVTRKTGREYTPEVDIRYFKIAVV